MADGSAHDGRCGRGLFLVLGFGLFGKNLLNVWPIVAGVALYSRFRGEPVHAHLNTAFFGAALAPIFSEILFSTDLAPSASVPLALATGLAVGFILPPAAAHLFRAHMGFSLYNMGFTAGIVGTLVVAMFKAFGYVPDPVFIWTRGANLLSRDFSPSSSPRWSGSATVLDRGMPERLAVIMKAPGRAPTDFIALAGFGATLANMGLAGALGAAYVLGTGGDLNGPSIGAILTIVGFAAFGKHPRNIAPIMLGVLIGALARSMSPADPSLTLAALFGTTLAPIAGRFGFGWGVVAGFIHSSAALTVGALHAGLNLYNNGFAAGIVASVLVPVIVALRAGLGYRDDLDAEAAASADRDGSFRLVRGSRPVARQQEHPRDENERRGQRRDRERTQGDIERRLGDDGEDDPERRIGRRVEARPAEDDAERNRRQHRAEAEKALGDEVALGPEPVRDDDGEDCAAERKERRGDGTDRKTRKQQKGGDDARLEKNLRDRQQHAADIGPIPAETDAAGSNGATTSAVGKAAPESPANP